MVQNCKIYNNNAPNGGGVYNQGIIANCKIYGNAADSKGGGVYMNRSVSETYFCDFYSNTALDGAAVFVEDGKLHDSIIHSNTGDYTIVYNKVNGIVGNCTIAYNTLNNTSYAALYNRGSVYNSIIWGNSGSEVQNSGSISYSCFDTGSGTNISDDPQFLNNVPPYDLHLSATSPCIDVGDNEHVYANTDFDGSQRIYNSTVDMGAFEYAPKSVDFTANPTSGTVPLSVTFTVNANFTPTAYAWDFDNDGTIDSTEENPSYTYDEPGLYTVKLIVYNGGGSRERIRTDYISVAPADALDYDAQYIGDTIPDEIYSYTSYKVRIIYKNTGKKTWYREDRIKLGAVGDSDSITKVWRVGIEPDHPIRYGEVKIFEFYVYATEPGTYTTDWQMVKESDFWFGKVFSKEVRVIWKTDVENKVWDLFK